MSGWFHVPVCALMTWRVKPLPSVPAAAPLVSSNSESPHATTFSWSSWLVYALQLGGLGGGGKGGGEGGCGENGGRGGGGLGDLSTHTQICDHAPPVPHCTLVVRVL